MLAADSTIVYQSPSIERVLGYAAEDLVGSFFDQLLAPGEEGRLLHVLANRPLSPEPQVLECALRHADGSVRQFEIFYTDLLEDENVRGIVLNGRDVSERKAFEEQLAHQAFHDPVTNLANRALFVERVRHAVARARREHSGLSVLFVDLDDFKTVNDSLGHAAGDTVLLEVARRLDACVRASDTAARFGGDEFAVVLEDITSAQEAADTAERILESLAAPLTVDGKEIYIGSSLGISVVTGEPSADADELIRNADAAMYIAKREGKGGYRIFEPAMHEGVLERLELRADLQRAMAGGQLELHYQPVVRLADGSVTGVEALLRWRHPERGMVPPDVFISLAEEMGLIVPIGRWVLREACRQASEIRSLLPAGPPLSMAVNLSVKQLQHSDIVADVADALAESALAACSLTLEITETVMITDTETSLQRLHDLKDLGVRLAMDDFGTGYSSLSHLSQLPVDIIKMDRSFLSAGASPQTLGAGERGGRSRRDTAPRGRRRGDRARGAVGRPARARLRPGSGLPVRPADGRSRHARVPARHGRRAAPHACRIARHATASACCRRCAIATSACCGAACASRWSATASSSSRSPGRSTRCPTRRPPSQSWRSP